MSRYVFDLESNGLLDSLTKIHCIVLKDLDSGEIINCCNDKSYTYTQTVGAELQDCKSSPIEYGIKLLQEAEEIIGHNIIKFDILAIQKLYPSFKPKGKIFDTLIAAKLIYPDISDIDYRSIARRKYHLPKNLIGKYSLKAFGYRLGELKGDYCEEENCWSEWSAEMQRYCNQDVVVTEKLYNKLVSRGYSQEALDLEQKFAEIISRQEQRGVCFDLDKARQLDSTLRQRKYELETELKRLFPPVIQTETFIPKVNNKTRGYVAGVPFEKKTTIEFNPSSRLMVAQRLIKKYGWKPKEKSPTGLPKIDETVLKDLPYPEAPALVEYFTVAKTLGQLSEGKNAWLKLEKNGRIYGSVDTLGTVSRRGCHSRPNLGQVPAVGNPFGEECRELFIASPGMVLVGADLSGLELRCLAHYMNDPDYTREVISGDIHTKNQIAAGLPTRNDAKRFIYAFLYGGGDQLIGEIVGGGAKEGKKIKQQFLKQIPALNKLITSVRKKAKDRGYLLSIDKQKLKVRGDYLALNLLLQNLGALVAKKARVILDDLLTETGWVEGKDYAEVLWVHDEYQFECIPAIADELGQLVVKSFELAGEAYNLNCPITGAYKIGKNWAETH